MNVKCLELGCGHDNFLFMSTVPGTVVVFVFNRVLPGKNKIPFDSAEEGSLIGEMVP